VTDTDEELLADLLLQWEELRERGQDTPAAELCKDHPQLADELARRIHALKVTSWLDKPLGPGDDGTGLPSSTPTEPRTLIGRYRLDNLIATGGFAQVWRGYDLELQRVVAVKVPKPSRLQSADAFMAEARRVARLKHPGIVPVFDVGRDGDVCFIVSEFVEGGSLGDHLSRNPPTQQQAIRWIAEIADALEYAHLHGVIHRDIKPANILIDHHGRALLADFGIAQSANKAGQEALSLGTLRYMSPEQLEGKPVDPRSDIFSLGVVLHEALTGKLPYSSAEPNVLRREIVSGIKVIAAPQIPAELKAVCQKALQHDPQRRHISAAHIAAELRRCLKSPRSSFWPWILLLVILALVFGEFFWWKSQQPAQVEQRNRDIEESRAETSATTPQKSDLTVPELMTLGKENFDRNYFDKAAENYAQVISLDPMNAEAYDKRGACRFNSGEFKASLSDFTKAIELDSNNPEFLKHRAMSYASLRQFDPAITDMEQAVSLKPLDLLSFQETLAIIYSNRAAERSNAKQYAEAADDVSQAIKHFPQGNVFYHQRGSCYFNMKEYEKALADFTEAIKREPNKGAHYLHRGYCLQNLGREQEAAADFDKAKNLGEKE
jgi:serine/threonine protein kinase